MTAKRRFRRFYSSTSLPPQGEHLLLSSSESRHLRDLIRLGKGDKCLVIDGQGHEARASIQGFTEDGRAKLMITDLSPVKDDLPMLSLHAYVAIPRRTKVEYFIEKAQELNLAALHPLETERSMVHIPEKRLTAKWDRWHKIAVEAAKQSGTARLVDLHKPENVREASVRIPERQRVAVFHPGSESMGFRHWIEEVENDRGDHAGLSLHVFLGPEGGFSDREVDGLRQAATEKKCFFSLVELGPHILKVDTAFSSVLGALRLLLE